jgi:hypothetical protein
MACIERRNTDQWRLEWGRDLNSGVALVLVKFEYQTNHSNTADAVRDALSVGELVYNGAFDIGVQYRRSWFKRSRNWIEDVIRNELKAFPYLRIQDNAFEESPVISSKTENVIMDGLRLLNEGIPDDSQYRKFSEAEISEGLEDLRVLRARIRFIDLAEMARGD